MRHTVIHLNWMTKAILVLFILVMLAVGGFAIRMAQGPLDLEFIKPKIEAALSDSIEGQSIRINKLALSWPAWNEPVLLDLHQVQIIQDSNNNQVNRIEKMSIGLATKYLLIGKVLPSIVVVEDPVFQLVEQNGELNFMWQASQPKKKAEKEVVEPDVDPEEIKRSLKDFLNEIFASENNKDHILSAIRKIELKRAVLKSINIRENEESYLALIDLNLNKSNQGLVGDLIVSLPTSEGRKASLKSDVMYRKAQEDILFTASVTDLNPSYLTDFFPATKALKGQDIFIDGQVQAAFDNRFALQNASVDFQIAEGKIVVPNYYDDGLALKDIDFKANYNRSNGVLNIEEFQANVGDIPISLQSKAIIKGQSVSAPFVINIEEFQTNNLNALVPPSAKDNVIGQWASYKLSEGRIFDTQIAGDFLLTPKANVEIDKNFIGPIKPSPKNYDTDVKNLKAGFKAEGVTVQYVDTLKPASNVIAEGVYENDTLTITGQQADVEDIKGRDVTVKLTNLSVEGGGMAYVSLKAKGPLKTALLYAKDEPIGLGEDLGFNVNDVQGEVDFGLDLEFPTLEDLPKERVIVKLEGDVTNLLLPNIVKRLPLTGGPYALKFSDGKISLEGKGQLAKRDIDVAWEEFISPEGQDYHSKITAKLEADDALRKAFNIGLEEYITGPVPVDVTYTDRGVPAVIDVKGDLTKAVLRVDPFNYKKPSGVTGTLSLKAMMKNDDLQEVDQLNVKAEGFSLKDGRLIFKKLKDGSDDISQGSIAQAVIGKSNLKVDFEITPSNVLKIVAAGPVFDAKPFLKKETEDVVPSNTAQWDNPQKDSGTQQQMQISLNAKKILTDTNAVLEDSKLYLETDGQGDVTRAELDSTLGKGDLYVRFRPNNETGKRIFRLESSDAGETLKAFGLYDKIIGGNLVIYGEPKSGDLTGNIFGQAEMSDFSVANAPVLANLLSAMSLTGVQDVLQNNGLYFSKLESDFEWQFRKGGNLLVMKEGRTSGSSLGLTFEGLYDQQASKIDVSGTVIPLSGVNKAIGEIPVLGKILTGGKAFLAATYKVEGPSADPKVSINPLSVLAPGFIRNILFEESVESKIEKAQ